MRAALALSAVLLLAGCGGGDQDFPRTATAVCEETNAEIRALGTPESFTDTQLFARQAKGAVDDQIRDLEKLEPPAEDAEAFDRYLATLRERARLLGQMAEAADATSMNDVRQVGTELGRIDVTAREQATAIGLGACEPQ